ncbi:MAG: AMP-binding protein [Alphaproteobacteria bacterium]|nr:AMP-binding protein [Alphaproteobacteria bacterium]
MNEPRDDTTLQDFARGLARWGDRPAVVSVAADGAVSRWPHAELSRLTLSVAAGLAHDGVRAGEAVAILSPNRAEWILARLALLELGALAVPLDDMLGDDEIARGLARAGARRVFTTRAYVERLRSLPDGSGLVLHLLDDADTEGPGVSGWRWLLQDPRLPARTVLPDEAASLFYTSGTTGVPKGVPLSHRNLVVNLSILRAGHFLGPDDRVMLPLPLHHSYPFLIGMLLPLAYGAAIVLPAGVTGPEIAAALRAGEASAMVGVPRLYESLAAGIQGRVASRGPVARALFGAMLKLSLAVYDGLGVRIGHRLFASLHRQLAPRLRLMACGGAYLEPDIERTLTGLGWLVLTGYGLVETTSISTFNPLDAPRIGSAGRAGPGIHVRIAPITVGEESSAGGLGPEGLGEVQIKGPNVFAGYLNDEAANQAAFTGDGWFRSGDLGRLDKDGYLHITGRVKELIVLAGGKNISPENLEAHYAQVPYVREVAVLERRGALVALVRPNLDALRQAGTSRIDQALRMALSESAQALPSFQRLSGFALVNEALPRTRLGKFRRHALRALYDAAETGRREGAARTPSAAEQVWLDSPRGRALWAWLRGRFPGRVLDLDTVLQLDLGVDSLAWVELGLELEKRFALKPDETMLARVVTLGDLLREVVEAPESHAPGAATPADEPDWFAPRPGWLTAFGFVLYALLWVLTRILFRLRLAGREHLPRDGQAVFTPNHLSDLDVFVLVASLPWSHAKRLAWGGDVERLFNTPALRLLARVAGVFPVDDRRPARSIALARAGLAAGRSLVWFPESWRSPDGSLQRFLPGIGHVLRGYHGPVIPVRIAGTYEAQPRGQKLPRPVPVQIHLGAPLFTQSHAGEGEAQAAERITRKLHDRVAALGGEP